MTILGILPGAHPSRRRKVGEFASVALPLHASFSLSSRQSAFGDEGPASIAVAVAFPGGPSFPPSEGWGEICPQQPLVRRVNLFLALTQNPALRPSVLWTFRFFVLFSWLASWCYHLATYREGWSSVHSNASSKNPKCPACGANIKFLRIRFDEPFPCPACDRQLMAPEPYHKRFLLFCRILAAVVAATATYR